MTEGMRAILASGSPRRRTMLEAAGVEPVIIVPRLDDADVPLAAQDPCALVMSLAWFKARIVLAQIAANRDVPADLPRWLVAADTVCVQDGRVRGKPTNAEEAHSMLRSFDGREHEVITGVCLVDRQSGARRLFFDSAAVTLGEMDPHELERYVASGEWQGKAGGYNYEDRLAAGWPLRCLGDPQTIMGLPMRLVLPAMGVAARPGSSVA